jgi:hypothetical protein
MRKFVVIIFIALFSNFIFAKENTVKVKVFGSGNTADLAIKNALRSALEQVNGAFISSRTEVFNQLIASDEIVSISNGAIVEYEVLKKTEVNNMFHVTIEAIVSASELVNYMSKNTSSSVSLKGDLFVSNAAQQKMNQKAEEIALTNIFDVYKKIYMNSFDVKLTLDAPVSCTQDSYFANCLRPIKGVKNSASFFEIKAHLIVVVNKNMKQVVSFLNENLKAISISESEALNFKNLTGNECWNFNGMWFRSNPNIKINYRVNEEHVFGARKQEEIAYFFLSKCILKDGLSEYQFSKHGIKAHGGDWRKFTSSNNNLEYIMSNAVNDKQYNVRRYTSLKTGQKFEFNFSVAYTDEELKKITELKLN